jgi:hypothetical protein
VVVSNLSVDCKGAGKAREGEGEGDRESEGKGFCLVEFVCLFLNIKYIHIPIINPKKTMAHIYKNL